MTKNEVIKNNYAKSYIVAVLLITWLITAILFINPSTGLKFFSLIMFIPGILVIVFRKVQYKGRNVKNECFIRKINLKSFLFGILYPILFILSISLITSIIGIGKCNTTKVITIKDIITFFITIIVGLFSALGEEYGWRGYLLPELTKKNGKIKSTVIVGAVWTLFHIPAVFLLARTTGMSNPLLICIIQASAAFVFSFPFSFCYYLSENLVPVLFFHSIWNTVNTMVLGNIYTNKQGIIEGNLLLINGEGVLGVVLGTVIIYWFVKQFKKDNFSTLLKQ